MPDTVIRVAGLGKKYIIGHQRNGSEGLRHALQDRLSAESGSQIEFPRICFAIYGSNIGL
jgi:hypothetical protein